MKRWLLTIVLGCGLVTAAQAEKPERPDGPRKCEAIREAHKDNRAARKDHRQQQKAEAKALRESLKDLSPDERIAARIAHRKEQHQENKAFGEELYQNLVSAIRSCEEMPADRQEKMLAKVADHHQEAVAFHEGIHSEVISFMQEIKASDMEPKEKKKALKAFRQDIREKVKDWRASHRPERRGGKDRG